MTTPSTNIYVHPGWASYTWNYAGTVMASGMSTSTVTAVSFDIQSSSGQQLTRGELQYSADNGKTWTSYAAPVDGQGAWIAASGIAWRFLDRTGTDGSTPNTFSAHYKLADGSVVTLDNSVIADNVPVGVSATGDTMLSTMPAGAVVDILTPIDTGLPTGGRWVIDSQSQPGLFSIAYDPAVDTTARLVIANPAQMPASGLAAAVTVHYYERSQLDTNGNPIAGQGVARTLAYTVEPGSTSDLQGFGNEFKIGGAFTGQGGGPAMAALSTGGFVTVWQGADTVAGGAGAGLWAQLRGNDGSALGNAFALTPNGDAKLEGQPAVSALAGGRYVVAYSLLEGGASKVAYRVIEANGSAGSERLLDNGAGGDAAMPAVATLADGSYVLAWRSGGTVHVQQAGADGNAIGGQQVYGALSSAYSPSIAALKQGGYVLSWGEIKDGNVYAATSATGSMGSMGTPWIVSGDGAAASISTAAPLPHVTTLANGGFVVTWDSYANEPRGFSICDVFYRVYDSAGRALGLPAQANIESGGGHFDAAVTALSDGGFVIAWQSQSGDYDGAGVFGRRFAADGSAVDATEFEINQMRAGDQASPDLAALANGGFAAAWADTPFDGGGPAVEGRVFQVQAGAVVPVQGGSQTVSSGNASGGDAVTAPVTSPVTTPVVTAPVVSSPVVSSPVVSSPAPSAPVTSSPVTTAPVATAPAAPGIPAANTVAGSAGSDLLVATATSKLLDGHDGLDTALFGSVRTLYQVTKDSSGYTVQDFNGARTALANVERIHFTDANVALDIDGAGGQAYRLYQAAFNRTPDKAGVGFWIGMMDKGLSLQQAAEGFIASREFSNTYGAGSTDAQFVTALYQNVLHRAAEGAGFDFWVHALQVAPRAEVLAGFSESLENQAQVIGAIQNGFDYIPWA